MTGASTDVCGLPRVRLRPKEDRELSPAGNHAAAGRQKLTDRIPPK